MTILPMHEPALTTYNVYGSIFSIIGDEEYLPWMYEHFIGIAINKVDDTPYFTDHFSFFEYSEHSCCPWIKVERLIHKQIEQVFNNMSVIDVIKEALAMQKYVWLYLDQYYISSSDYYQKKHFDHSTLIYGIDEEQQIVYIADNLSNGKFMKTICSFDVVEQAWRDDICRKYRRFFIFLSKQKGSYSFNKNKIITSINDYIYSKPIDTGVYWDQVPTDGPHAYIQNKKNWIFGQKYYEYLISLIKDNEHIDIRAYHLSLEHKKCMLSRIKYLLPESSCYEDYKEIEHKATILRNMVLKYNITHNSSLLSKLELGIEDMVNREFSILKRFLHELELSK